MATQNINLTNVDSATFNGQEVYEIRLQEGSAEPQTIWTDGGVWISQHPFSHFRGHYRKSQGLHNGKPFYMKNGSAPRDFIYYEATLDVWYLDQARSYWAGGGEDTNIPPTDDVSNGSLGGCTIQDTWGGSGQKDTPDLAWWRSDGLSITGDTTEWDGIENMCGMSTTGKVYAFEVRTTPGVNNGITLPHLGPNKYKSHSSLAEWDNKVWYSARNALQNRHVFHNRPIYFFDTGATFPNHSSGRAIFYSAYDRRWKFTSSVWNYYESEVVSTEFQSEVTFSELPPMEQSKWTSAAGETIYLTVHEQ